MLIEVRELWRDLAVGPPLTFLARLTFLGTVFALPGMALGSFALGRYAGGQVVNAAVGGWINGHRAVAAIVFVALWINVVLRLADD